MKYYLNYDKNNNIVGYSNCLNTGDDFECREVSKEIYMDYIETLKIPTSQELLKQELVELENWFDEYDNQVKQYNRCQRMGIAYDKDIAELDNQAKVNAERITEIRNILKGE